MSGTLPKKIVDALRDRDQILPGETGALKKVMTWAAAPRCATCGSLVGTNAAGEPAACKPCLAQRYFALISGGGK